MGRLNVGPASGSLEDRLWEGRCTLLARSKLDLSLHLTMKSVF